MSHHSSAAANSAAASTSDDPYAPFYYWDAGANNWAFDYNSYYATYGYPADYYTSGGASSSSAYAYPSTDAAASAANPYYLDYQTTTTAQPAASSSSTPIVDPFAGPSSAPPPADVRYDEHGRAIPGKLRKGETRPTVLRRAAGKVWEDQTMLEWDPAHKRLFVGDLGGDVSDEMLAAAFDKWASFARARVVRAKDGKSKGYGFVAFADPEDFLKAWKAMDGKYIGSRPCRIKKAADTLNVVQIGARKDRLLAIAAKQDKNAHKRKMGGAVGASLPRTGLASKPKPY